MRPARVLVGVAALCAACGDDTGSAMDSIPTTSAVVASGTTTEMHAATGAVPTTSDQRSTPSAAAESTTPYVRSDIRVTVQNIEPPFPEQSLLDTFVTNGIEWNIYDVGPENGTVTVARGTAGPITVLVGVQGWTFDASVHPTLPVTATVARSVVVDLAGA